MNVSSSFVNITSEQPAALFAFYRDVVGLQVNPNMGEHSFDIGGTPGVATLGIDGHSETNGETKEPSRVLLSLFVDDAKSERERMEKAGVTFVRKEGREEWGGVISTFLDPDGNYCQVIQFDPAQAPA